MCYDKLTHITCKPLGRGKSLQLLQGLKIKHPRNHAASFSPEFGVFHDGSKVGQTPLWLERVKAGTHQLVIGDLEKEINVKEGRTLKVGLFKGRNERTSAAGRN